MTGEGIGQFSGPVAGIAERPVGEAPLPGGPVRLQEAADHDALAGDGLDPQDVPVGQDPARLARLDGVVVAAADEQVACGRFGAVGDPDAPRGVDQVEVDQVLADPGGQFPAPGPVRRHQQDVASGQVAGHVGAGGLIHGLLGWGTADAAVLVVLIQRGGVAPAQPE